MILSSLGISLIFHSYISPEVYELFVKEISTKFKADINKFKTIYDITSALVAVVLSFSIFGFGHFEDVKAGTIICALINGTLIGLISKALDNTFTFKGSLPFRKYFEM